ncbi:alpha-ketoglutarate-dependent dioxygenase AlkB [Shewanella sp. AS16]|uniref:alpha-ketoglutarate-dependent dioxygenase AlkB family protein n=1 Tax=Shewanella sp. AS16 TaxID=2907625 RepID=UPI001F17EDC7|nr:alpha-ketoglutarate-dependent dioxygenase AlkB [Shewanella sp. AS16]MCE9686321.1 alpha-ketoglutarate-dependent dioxygenase AlkB [Shewanella sp. AS16]
MRQQDLAFDWPQAVGPASAAEPERVVAPVTYVPGYLNPAQQAALYEEAKGYPLSSPDIRVYGQRYKIPRSQAWFGDDGCDYLFSSHLVKALPWPKYANKLRHKLMREMGLRLNGVLVNCYADGSETVGWHSDDETEIAPHSTIASVSLGATRDFVIRHKQTQQKMSFALAAGDLLLMHWPMQQEWEHALPKRLKVTEPRLNFTFRHLLVDFHAGG